MLVPEQRFGAAKLAEIAADVLLRRVNSGDSTTPDVFRQELLQTGWEIIRARPTMGPLVNLISMVLWKIEKSESPHELHDAVTVATSEFKRQLRQHAVHVAEEALNLIEDGSTIVTLSLSTTVQYALSHAQRAGRHFSVICAESRPVCEGRHTAEALASLGIPVTLMVDTAALAAVPSAQLVLVGADMLTHRGLVNKTGTFALAILARASGVPFYTLCGSSKFLPSKFQPPVSPDWPATDIWDQQRTHMAIQNPLCDTTSLELISGIVTERGTLPLAAIEAWLAALRIHPALTIPHPNLVEQI
jgi:translation initiation factor 2B subunit (eIF-2B alpha/beta/delta family)